MDHPQFIHQDAVGRSVAASRLAEISRRHIPRKISAASFERMKDEPRETGHNSARQITPFPIELRTHFALNTIPT